MSVQSLHLEPGVVLFGLSYPVRPQEVTMDRCSAAAAAAAPAAAMSLSELPLQWAVLWKILSGGDVQGHSLSLLLTCRYISKSLSLSRLTRLSLFPLFLSCFFPRLLSLFSPSVFHRPAFS